MAFSGGRCENLRVAGRESGSLDRAWRFGYEIVSNSVRRNDCSVVSPCRRSARKGEHWKESRGGLLVSMSGKQHKSDPQPNLPSELRYEAMADKLSEIGKTGAKLDSPEETETTEGTSTAAYTSVLDIFHAFTGRTQQRPSRGHPQVACLLRKPRLSDGLPHLSLRGLPADEQPMVKQVSRRVKGTEKYWSSSGSEAILRLCSEYLSDDEAVSRRSWYARKR